MNRVRLTRVQAERLARFVVEQHDQLEDGLLVEERDHPPRVVMRAADGRPLLTLLRRRQVSGRGQVSSGTRNER